MPAQSAKLAGTKDGIPVKARGTNIFSLGYVFAKIEVPCAVCEDVAMN